MSQTDYYSLYLFLKDVPYLPYIIVGGPGVINVKPILHFIDSAWFGRCDNEINNILNHTLHKSLWIKENDKLSRSLTEYFRYGLPVHRGSSRAQID